jgi:ABC-type nickel/cobalt efflux system permease component RcnA
MMFNPTYFGVVLIGLLHGLEPGHGWPVAMLYSVRRRNVILSAALSSSIIGVAHLISSIAVVVAYVLLETWLDFDIPWLKYVAAGLLLILAFRMWREKVNDMERQHGHLHDEAVVLKHEHEHEHPGIGKHTHKHKHLAGAAMSLWGLASFAFILGFAHEEEFALLALVAGGVNAWALMLAYGIAVLLGLVAVTVLCVKVYTRLEPKLRRYESYIPKAGAAIMVLMAILIVIW